MFLELDVLVYSSFDRSSTIARYAQVCWLCCVLYMPLLGLVQARPSCVPTFSGSKWILSALKIFLSNTTFLGNVLILVALNKVTSIYPPTKLFFWFLAVTDLCVGLNTANLCNRHVRWLRQSQIWTGMLGAPFDVFQVWFSVVQVYPSWRRPQLVWTDLSPCCWDWDRGMT